MAMIEARNIKRTYGNLQVLKGVDIDIEQGEIVSIVGRSGAGKSTLLHILGTIDRPDAGTVTVANTDVLKLGNRQLAAFRNRYIGFIFQFHHLLPEFNAFENVCMPAYIMGRDKKKVHDRAYYLLEVLGLKGREKHRPSQLSGGEQQRVAVARALINSPAVVMADEPSGNLDSKTANDLHKLFFELRMQFEQTFLIVTHNNDLAQMADRTLTIQDGVFINHEDHLVNTTKQ